MRWVHAIGMYDIAFSFAHFFFVVRKFHSIWITIVPMVCANEKQEKNQHWKYATRNAKTRTEELVVPIEVEQFPFDHLMFCPRRPGHINRIWARFKRKKKCWCFRTKNAKSKMKNAVAYKIEYKFYFGKIIARTLSIIMSLTDCECYDRSDAI